MALTPEEFTALVAAVEAEMLNNNEITAGVAREMINRVAYAFTKNPAKIYGLSLDQYNFDRTCFHLGYSIGTVPAGDYARLVEATTSIPSEYYYNNIVTLIERCERAFRLTELANPAVKSRVEQIAGDTDRTLAYSDYAQSSAIWNKEYLKQCDFLAQALWVPNYKDPGVARYRFERTGAEFIQAIPGFPTMSIASRFYLQSDYR